MTKRKTLLGPSTETGFLMVHSAVISTPRVGTHALHKHDTLWSSPYSASIKSAIACALGVDAEWQQIAMGYFTLEFSL